MRVTSSRIYLSTSAISVSTNFPLPNDNIVQKQFLTFDNNTVIEEVVSVVHWLRTWKDRAKIRCIFKM